MNKTMTIRETRDFFQRCLIAVGHTAEEAAIISDHLIDNELRGMRYGGISRVVSIVDRLTQSPEIREPIRVVHETPVSATIDGGAQVGYLVGYRATRILIDKAKTNGIAVVGASNTYFTGMLSFYAEMATREGLVMIAAGSSAWHVAPYGSSESRLGTNPIAFAFPTGGDPIIFDAAMSSIMHAEATFLERMGLPLPEGIGFDSAGNPTRDPSAAKEGAFAVWGQGKGSGLSTAVQLLGMLGGSAVKPKQEVDCSLYLMAMKPDLLIPTRELEEKARSFGEQVRAARPLDPSTPVRMPFDQSAKRRDEALKSDSISVPTVFYNRLEKFLATRANRNPLNQHGA